MLAFLHFTVASVFEPGRAALMPSLLAPADLVAGSTLSTVTWSVMAALGGLAGGTFLTIAGPARGLRPRLAHLRRLRRADRLDPERPARPGPRATRAESRVRFLAAVRYLIAHPVTGATLLVKGMNGLAVVDTFIVIYGTRLFARGEGGAALGGPALCLLRPGRAAGPDAAEPQRTTARRRGCGASSRWALGCWPWGF